MLSMLTSDPYGEHDFGAVQVQGHKVFFKIDSYDLWTRGRDYPIGRLEGRLKCPSCDNRRVLVAFIPPSEPGRASVSRNDDGEVGVGSDVEVGTRVEVVGLHLDCVDGAVRVGGIQKCSCNGAYIALHCRDDGQDSR